MITDEKLDLSETLDAMMFDGIKAWPQPPDIEGVQTCAFLQSIRQNTDTIEHGKLSYKRVLAFSILIHLHENTQDSKLKARELCHEYVKDNPEYNSESQYVIDAEIEVALTRGPATCEQILLINDECEHCKSGEHLSPILFEGPNHSRSRSTGFWEVKLNAKGIPVSKSPDYQGMVKEFRRHHEFAVMSDQGTVYIYKENHWVQTNDLDIKAFCEDIMDPKPLDYQRKEFLSLIKLKERRPSDWFLESVEGFINLQNGVFCIETGELLPHDKKYGFKYILPYDYDKDAECSIFDQFMLDISCKDLEKISLLQEYLGYAIAGGPCDKGEKALFLYGPTASNGKSTLVNIMSDLVGRDNHSSITLDALNKDTKRYLLEGKLFNISEETNIKALNESEVFKTMVTGGVLDVKRLYVQDYSIKNTAKLFILCNELPKSGDRTDGLYRRMIIFPMNAKFSDNIGNRIYDMRERMQAELPGIFNFCVEGYKRLKKNKYKFTESVETNSMLDEYKTENNNVLLWFNEKAEKTDNMENYIDKDIIYNNYKNFCEEAGIDRPLNKPWFYRSLKLLTPIEEKKKLLQTGKQIRTIHGLKLLN